MSADALEASAKRSDPHVEMPATEAPVPEGITLGRVLAMLSTSPAYQIGYAIGISNSRYYEQDTASEPEGTVPEELYNALMERSRLLEEQLASTEARLMQAQRALQDFLEA